MTSRGFLMFAHNNAALDYGLVALCNALMIKSNSDAQVAVITDQGTLDWLIESRGQKIVDYAFDHVLVHAPPDPDGPKRRFSDTRYTTFNERWYNETRTSAYDHTPFDETILIDSDYLICDRVLENVWGSEAEVRMNKHAINLEHGEMSEREQRLDHLSIPMYWATCVYFRKSWFAQVMFSLVDVIRENYDYYQFLYSFPGGLFRNDYAFSIAAHIMSGWIEDVIEPLPSPTILTSLENDELIDVPDRDTMLFLVEDTKEHWKYKASRVEKISTHVMNKSAITRNAEKIIALYGVPNE